MNYKKYLFSFALITALISSNAVALTLDEARAQGLVGEPLVVMLLVKTKP